MPGIQLPNELWLRIFENNTDVLDRCDLGAVIRTCKTFHNLAIRSLYRHVVWKNPISLIHSLSFLRRARDEQWFILPRSLTIGVSRMTANGRCAIASEDEKILPARGEQRLAATRAELRDFASFAVLESGSTAYDFRIQLFANSRLHHSMLRFTESFAHLQELRFSEVILPDTFHPLLHRFPNLQKLHLEMCVIPPSLSAPDVDHTDLPITELTLRGLYHGPDTVYHHDPEVAGLTPDEVFRLAEAQSLETLHIDTTARIFTLFGRQSSPPVPPNLKRLFLYRSKLTKYDWRPAGAGLAQLRIQETASLMFNMSLFLSEAPKIESISTCFAFSDTIVLPNHFDTEHLREFSGPIASLSFQPLTFARNLRAIHLIDDKSVFLLNAEKLGHDFGGLEVFSLHATRWDDEIVLAACSVFSNALRIRIEYNGQGPTDNFIVGLGPHVLTRMGRLHTFQLFETNGNPPVVEGGWQGDDWTTEGMLKTLILPWNKYCLQLREVQLVSGYLWRRADEKDWWAQRFFLPETDEAIWKSSVFWSG